MCIKLNVPQLCCPILSGLLQCLTVNTDAAASVLARFIIEFNSDPARESDNISGCACYPTRLDSAQLNSGITLK